MSKPQHPYVLATAAVSSLVLARDAQARSVAPNYWTWSSAAHETMVETLRSLESANIRALLSSVEENPRSSVACRRLVDALVPLMGAGGSSAAAARLVEAAQDVECLSRLLVHFGNGSDLSREVLDGAAGAETLLNGIARLPHGGSHAVDAAVVIPFRATLQGQDRVVNLAAVLNALSHQTYPREKYRIIVVESDSEPRWQQLFSRYCDRYLFAPCSGPFNKSWTVNVGVVHGARPTELVCIIDGDILVDHDFISRNVQRFQEAGTQAHWPYRDLLCLDEWASERARQRRCLEAAARVSTDDLRGVYMRRSPGACIWVRESLFTRIGGMDERFAGWGGEDEDFAWRVERHAPLDSYRDVLAHLHHGRAPHKAESGVAFYDDKEKFSFCSWPCDSVIGQIDRFTR